MDQDITATQPPEPSPVDVAWETYIRSAEMVTSLDDTQWERRKASFRAGWDHAYDLLTKTS